MVWKIVFESAETRLSEVGETREKVRRTRGESSASTDRAERAAEARRAVGSGMSMVSEHGNSSSVAMFAEVCRGKGWFLYCWVCVSVDSKKCCSLW